MQKVIEEVRPRFPLPNAQCLDNKHHMKKETSVHDPDPASGSTPERKVAPASKAIQVLTKERKKSKLKPTEFREDAKIWQVYLEEAEEKANDKAELWRTGLDSLLIFVRPPWSFRERTSV